MFVEAANPTQLVLLRHRCIEVAGLPGWLPQVNPAADENGRQNRPPARMLWVARQHKRVSQGDYSTLILASFPSRRQWRGGRQLGSQARPAVGDPGKRWPRFALAGPGALSQDRAAGYGEAQQRKPMASLTWMRELKRLRSHAMLEAV